MTGDPAPEWSDPEPSPAWLPPAGPPPPPAARRGRPARLWLAGALALAALVVLLAGGAGVAVLWVTSESGPSEPTDPPTVAAPPSPLTVPTGPATTTAVPPTTAPATTTTPTTAAATPPAARPAPGGPTEQAFDGVETNITCTKTVSCDLIGPTDGRYVIRAGDTAPPTLTVPDLVVLNEQGVNECARTFTIDGDAIDRCFTGLVSNGVCPDDPTSNRYVVSLPRPRDGIVHARAATVCRSGRATSDLTLRPASGAPAGPVHPGAG